MSLKMNLSFNLIEKFVQIIHTLMNKSTVFIQPYIFKQFLKYK